MALPDYVEYPGGGRRRNIGRERILEVAQRSFARSTIIRWLVDQIEVRRHGDVAVCSYYWSEQAVLDGADLAVAGFATDVLVLQDGEWRYQSHHVSNLDPESA
jgi:ketosteroid isomerase-like protein